MNRPKTIPVDYIESGTFVGGEEDAFHFGVREAGPLCVIREEDLDALMVKINTLRALIRR